MTSECELIERKNRYLRPNQRLSEIAFEHDAVSWLAVFEVVEGVVDFGHGVFFDEWFDGVAGGEVEHLIDCRGAAKRGAGDGAFAAEDGEPGGFDFGNGADDMEFPAGAKGIDVGVPIERIVDGDENHVEASGDGLEGVGISCAEEVVGAEFFCFGFFVGSGGEGGDFAAPGFEEGEGHVAETADADDSDAVGRFDAVMGDGVKDGDAAAEEGASGDGINAFGNGNGPGGLAADFVGEAAVASDDGVGHLPFLLAAMVMAGHALVADEAGAGTPTEADTLAEFEMADVVADGGDASDGFVAGDEGVLRHLPFIVEHTEVAVTEAAVFDIDLDFVGFEIAGVEVEGFERSAGFMGCVGVELHLWCSRGENVVARRYQKRGFGLQGDCLMFAKGGDARSVIVFS